MPVKIYISGPISGLPLEPCILRFTAAELKMRKSGFETVNPFVINKSRNRTWREYMVNDIKHLMHCDAIYMLDGWKNSKGARIEHFIATEMGIKIIYENT